MNDKLATSKDLADFLNLTEGTLRNWRSEGAGPAYYKVANQVRYEMGEVRAWLQKQRVATSTPITRVEPERMLEILALIDKVREEGESPTDVLQKIENCDGDHAHWVEETDRKGLGLGEYHCRDCPLTPELGFALDIEFTMYDCGHEIYTARDYELLGHHVNAEVLPNLDVWSCSTEMDDWAE